MKKLIVLSWVLGSCVFFSACSKTKESGCWTGAFLGDKPSAAAIAQFQNDYGKKPYLILTFLDWGKYPDEKVIREVYGAGSVLAITWEPWNALQKKGIDYDALLAGKDDAYIREFALKLKAIEKPVFLRFAHEMNGDWYPWSGSKIGAEKYQQLFRYVRKIFDQAQARNVFWVFSINAENIPKGNDFKLCYPGGHFVDYIGLDGYNWGTTKPWSRRRSFREIFFGVYGDVVRSYHKPVIISEFGSTSTGEDKASWIEEALKTVRNMTEVKGLILFNVDKETDWRIVPGSDVGRKLKKGFEGPYFKSGLKSDQP